MSNNLISLTKQQLNPVDGIHQGWFTDFTNYLFLAHTYITFVSSLGLGTTLVRQSCHYHTAATKCNESQTEQQLNPSVEKPAHPQRVTPPMWMSVFFHRRGLATLVYMQNILTSPSIILFCKHVEAKVILVPCSVN